MQHGDVWSLQRWMSSHQSLLLLVQDVRPSEQLLLTQDVRPPELLHHAQDVRPPELHLHARDVQPLEQSSLHRMSIHQAPSCPYTGHS